MAAARPVSADPAAQGSHDAGVVARRHRGPRAFQFARSGAALEQAFPDEPVWYLQALGVHPDAQRRGVGAALLSAGQAPSMRTTPPAICTSDPVNVGITSGGDSSSPNLRSRQGPAGRRTRDDPPGADVRGWPPYVTWVLPSVRFAVPSRLGLVPSAAIGVPL